MGAPLVLGRSAYKLQFLVRTRLGWQRDFFPPIQLGDLRSGNPRSCCLTGRENAHSHRAGRVSVAAWGGQGGHNFIFEISLSYCGAVFRENGLVLGVDHELEIW